MLFLLFIILVLFLYHSNNLLLSLLILEMFSFIILYYTSFNLSTVFESDYIVLILFSIFVMEGVIALSGLIILVSFTGSDYVRSSTLRRL